MIRALVTFLLLAAPIASARPKTPPVDDEPIETRLTRAKQAYAHGDWRAVVDVVRPLLYPTVQVGSDDEVTARKILAMSYFFLGEKPRAEQEFDTLLQLNADFALDPVFDPPQAIAFLGAIQRRNAEKLRELREQKRREERERERHAEAHRREEEERLLRTLPPKIIYRVELRHAFALNFVPFGMGQFQNGDRKKGYAFASTEIALGVTSLAFWAAVQAKYDFGRRRVPAAEIDLANALSVTAVVTGALFWAEALAGVIDALVRYRPSVVVEEPKPTARISLVPVAAPGIAGVALQGGF